MAFAKYKCPVERPGFLIFDVVLFSVMPAHSRPKDGVASLAYVAGIHVFLF